MNSVSLAGLMIAVLWTVALPLAADDAVDFGRKFEPKGARVIHGAGQSLDAFESYWNAVGPNKPAVYMTYCALKRVQPDWFRQLAQNLDAFPGTMPQIGLSMTSDGKPEERYEHQVAAGQYDAQIAILCDGLKSLDRPVFLRIGYEFNGGWNGYHGDTYVAAWRKLVDAFRAAKVDNVATVWCFEPGGNPKYMDYYAGDDYVDWWSIDLFSPNQFDLQTTKDFTRDAREHKHPIMIGESTPRGVGVLGGEKSWNAWFARYFGYIRANPHVKAFCYINWNWGQTAQWANWGDCRIEQNEVVRSRFEAELRDPRYVHAMPKTEFLQTVW